MARLTLRLPDSLRDAITTLADKEGVSLNHYVVYALTQAAAAELLASHRQTFDDMRSRFPEDRAEAALDGLLAERAYPSLDRTGATVWRRP